jgi:hypothetical protein
VPVGSWDFNTEKEGEEEGGHGGVLAGGGPVPQPAIQAGAAVGATGGGAAPDFVDCVPNMRNPAEAGFRGASSAGCPTRTYVDDMFCLRQATTSGIATFL